MNLSIHVVKSLLIMLYLLFLTGMSHGADISRIVMFIVERNPELTERKSLNNSIFKNLKVDAYARAGYGQIDKEGTRTLETAQTNYAVGLTATLPLIGKRERSQRRAEMANKQLSLTKEVSDLLGQYLSEKKYIKLQEEYLQSLYNELQWIGKRVEAGVDYQTDYNTKLHAYTEKRRDLAQRVIVNEALLEKILSYVLEEHRDELKKQLEEPVPEDSEEEGQGLSLHR